MPSNRDMFGFDDMDAYVKSLEASIPFKLGGPTICIVSVLSDAQELVERGNKEAARRHINVAKHLVLRYLAPHYKAG